MEHFDKAGVIMADDLAVPHIQLRNFLHILLGELEIPNIKIQFHALFVNGLRDNDHSPLNIPAQGHLSGGLAVLASDLCQNRVGKNAKLALGKRPPRLRE